MEDTPQGREIAQQVHEALDHSTAKQRWIKVRLQTHSEEQYARIANAIRFLLTATDAFDWEVTIDPKASVTTANDELADVGDWVPYYPRDDDPGTPWFMCPSCGEMKVLRVIYGLPAEPPSVGPEGGWIVGGCLVFGNQPDLPVACTSCDWCGGLDDQWRVIEYDYAPRFTD